MSVKLNSNIESQNAQRRLAQSASALSRTFERLASGLRINRASDDAAGLAVATSLRTDSRIASQAVRNINDGLSLLNIGAGALEALSSIVVRIIELSEQSANGTLGDAQRGALDREASALQLEYNRITATTKYNDRLIFQDTESIEIQTALSGSISGLELNLGSSLLREQFSGSFLAPTTVVTAAGYRASRAEDFNHDGYTDILSWSQGGNRVSVSLGNGDGTFAPIVTYTALQNSAGIQFGDFNNDGNTDIVGTSVTSFDITLGNSDGSFKAQTFVTYGGVGNSSNRYSVGDVNSDGLDDIVFSLSGIGLEVFLSNGDGTFRPQGSFLPSLTNRPIVDFSDYNNDGLTDLYISMPGTVQPSVVALQNGDGTFRVSQVQTFAEQVIGVSDVNGDGLEDIVSLFAGLSVKFGNSDGTFKAGTNYSTTGTPSSGLLQDLNNDRYDDVILMKNNGDVSIFYGNSNGSFGGVQDYPVGSSPFARIASDVNSDSVPDLVYGFAASDFQILLANTDSVATLEAPDLRTSEKALQTLTKMKVALGRVSQEMGNIGALMSRLDASKSTLQVLGQGLQEASSQILDADISVESANLVRQQILQSTAQAILAQANQLPQLALNLIQGVR